MLACGAEIFDLEHQSLLYYQIAGMGLTFKINADDVVPSRWKSEAFDDTVATLKPIPFSAKLIHNMERHPLMARNVDLTT